MIIAPSSYQRLSRRRLARRLFYIVFGGVTGGLLYLVAGLYLPLFL